MSDSLKTDKLKTFCNLLAQEKGQFLVSHSRKLEFKGNFQNVQAALSVSGLSVEVDLDTYFISLTSLVGQTKVVFDQWIDQDFDDESIDKDTIFFHLAGEYILYQNGVITSYSASERFRNQVNGTITYFRLVKALKAEVVSDHHNEARKEFVFYSSTRGVIKISYTAVAPKFPTSIQSDNVDSLVKLIAAPNHKIFFINGLFKISNEKPSIELLTILENADSLASIIKRDYEITLKQFDFEKFKDNLLKEKDKYFYSIREIINKVFGQLVGIPISISASAFATYKVENEPFTLSLICFGFIFYVVIYIKIQTTYKSDLTDLQTDFKRDFEDIKSKSGLAPSVIDREKGKIEGKIVRTKSMISLMIGGIIVLGGSFVIYLGNQIVVTLTDFSLLSFLKNMVMGCK